MPSNMRMLTPFEAQAHQVESVPGLRILAVKNVYVLNRREVLRVALYVSKRPGESPFVGYFEDTAAGTGCGWYLHRVSSAGECHAIMEALRLYRAYCRENGLREGEDW